MVESDECWKPIPGFDGYQASTAGQIRNRWGRVLTGTLTKKECRQVNVRGAHGRVRVEVHRLVARPSSVHPRPALSSPT
jgi:hypothetical protein